MSNYIKQFDLESEYNEFVSGGVGSNFKIPLVSYTENTDDVKYDNYESIPLTFEIQSDGNIIWKTNNESNVKTIEYCKNKSNTWISITSNTGASAPSISVVSGDTVQFRGNNAAYGVSSTSYNTFSGTTCKFAVKGNIMSLLDSTNFSTKTSLDSGITFYGLFIYCTGVTDASKLKLPAITLSNWCYTCMFQGCTSLVSAPSLPAMELAEYCYQSMFQGCTTLTQAPMIVKGVETGYYDNMFEDYETPQGVPCLPATVLAMQCYTYMFAGCSSLTQAPELPATTMADSCYAYMFQSCISLVTAPELPSTTLVENCYGYMFSGCTNLTTAPSILPATILKPYCYTYMFYACSSLTTAPILPASTLSERCYYRMFRNCSSLNYIKCLATDISAPNCLVTWVTGVAASGTFVKDSNMPVGADGWGIGTAGIPSGWTVQDAV